MTEREWTEEAERLAEKIRERAGVDGQAVPPSEVARKLGFRVRVKELEDGLAGYHVEGTNRIVVAKGYEPRQQASIAHELIEANLPERLPDYLHEKFCERGAAGIALPRTLFIESLFRCGWDVPLLRRSEWQWASWEAIAMRASDLIPGVYAAAWVDDRVKWRSGHSANAVTQAERAAVIVAHGRHSKGVVVCAGKLAVAWRVPGGGASFRAISICLPVISRR